MDTENYRNWLKLEAECKRRTRLLLAKYYNANKDLFDEYVKDAFKKTRDASRMYDIPRNAKITNVEPAIIKDGLITFQLHFVDSEENTYMVAFMCSMDELELYKKLKNKTI